MIIALCGAKGSGKDTVANKINELYSHITRVQDIAFADPIKKMVQHIFDLDPSNDGQYDKFKRTRVTYDLPGYLTHAVAGRHVVREIGMLMRSYDENQFVKYIDDQINLNPGWIWVVTDLRFDNELEFLRNKGAYVVKLKRSDAHSDGHITERGFEDHQCDAVMNNDLPIHQLGIRVIETFDKVIKDNYETYSR